MVKEKIKALLTATFGLPVVEDINQTKIQNVIAYQITTIGVNTKNDNYQSLTLNVDIYFRSENGYDSIGYLSQKLAEKPVTIDDMEIKPTSGEETIEYDEITYIVLGKNVTIFIRANMDKVREQIKQIEME